MRGRGAEAANRFKLRHCGARDQFWALLPNGLQNMSADTLVQSLQQVARERSWDVVANISSGICGLSE